MRVSVSVAFRSKTFPLSWIHSWYLDSLVAFKIKVLSQEDLLHSLWTIQGTGQCFWACGWPVDWQLWYHLGASKKLRLLDLISNLLDQNLPGRHRGFWISQPLQVILMIPNFGILGEADQTVARVWNKNHIAVGSQPMKNNLLLWLLTVSTMLCIL